MRNPIFRLASTALTGLLFLAACQTGTMGPPSVSLEEAKKLTASFEQPTFTPPPRTTEDVLATLERLQGKQTGGDSEARTKRMEEARLVADGLPPANASDAEMVKFLWKRARAARDIGRNQMQIADLEEILRLVQASGGSSLGGHTEREILFALRHAEDNGGNALKATEYLRAGISKLPSNNYTSRMSQNAFLVFYELNLGNREGALRAQREYRAAETAYQNQFPGPFLIPKAFMRRADARIARHIDANNVAAERLYREALTFLDRANVANKRNDAIQKMYFRIDLIALLLSQGRLSEAEVLAREAITIAFDGFGRDSVYTANALSRLTDVLLLSGRTDEAEALSRKIIEIVERTNQRPESSTLARARRRLAQTLMTRKKWTEAVAIFDRIEEDMKPASHLFEHWYRGSADWAWALMRAGRAEQALANVTAHVQRRKGAEPNTTQQVLLAAAHAALGQDGAAFTGFQSVMPKYLAIDKSTYNAYSMANFRAVLETYMDVLSNASGTPLADGAGIDAVSEAYRMAGTARNPKVEAALAATASRAVLNATSGDPELAGLARKEQDVRHQIDALEGSLSNTLSTEFGAENPAAVEELRSRIDMLKGAHVTLLEEVRSRFPAYADLINPKPENLEQTRAVLRPGEALIATYVADNRTYVWAVPHSGDVAFAAVDLGREDLADTVALVRSSLEPNAATLGDIPEFDMEAAHGLYRKLLEPVKAGWKDAESLLVVAHGPLGYLPLSLLPTEPVKPAPEKGALFSNYRDVPWLVRDHAVTMLPSVASLRTLRTLPPGDVGRKAYSGFGDPWFSREQANQAANQAIQVSASTEGALATRGLPVHLRAAPDTTRFNSADLARLPRLPDTADEIRGTAVALNADLTEDVFLGARANEHMVKTVDLSGYKVLAFATHGLVPGDLDGLTQPALALSAPEVAGVEGDGLLTMGEILGLKLNADWVVLSACNTASGEGVGAEAVSGLGRAFFHAGTRALLVSNWPVETTSAKALTTDLFRRQAADPSLTRAEALRQTMLGLIDGPGYVDAKTGKAVFSYAHPIFWAPFTLIGDGGGGTGGPSS